jgi:alkanesulfonate monooxygenase SsuD/methylene tetrahydromethanopterin reductase-like flavin-dependent oxidoreductase (luciferase family)
MHVGMSVMFQGLEEGRSDLDVWKDQLALVDQAEPRGYDSVWTAEHHFARYVMSPSPLQFLTWMGSRTRRVKLGSMVMVIPWHDPVRLAEEIALLDNITGGRLVLGFGRGLGPTEFEGFRVPMGESRERFVEYAEAIVDGLDSGTMSYQGTHYNQPPVELHPAPAYKFAGRAYASAVSPESALIMARLGFGLMVIAQKPWERTIAEISDYRDLYREVNGTEAPRPLLVNFTSVHEDAERAQELEQVYGLAYSRSAADHYEFTNPRLEQIPGYEYYARLREGIEKRGLDTFVRFLAELQITGTPEEVVEQTIERVRLLDAGGVINVFSFGGMPSEIAQASLELYTDQVLPRLQEFEPERQIGSLSEPVEA